VKFFGGCDDGSGKIIVLVQRSTRETLSLRFKSDKYFKLINNLFLKRVQSCSHGCSDVSCFMVFYCITVYFFQSVFSF